MNGAAKSEIYPLYVSFHVKALIVRLKEFVYKVTKEGSTVRFIPTAKESRWPFPEDYRPEQNMTKLVLFDQFIEINDCLFTNFLVASLRETRIRCTGIE
jgi:hypothetical protein